MTPYVDGRLTDGTHEAAPTPIMRNFFQLCSMHLRYLSTRDHAFTCHKLGKSPATGNFSCRQRVLGGSDTP